GRASKPASHRYYKVKNDSIPAGLISTAEQAAPAAIKRCGHAGPKTVRGYRMPDGRNALDVQGTGAIAVCPPSLHSSGEVRGWLGGSPGEPSEIEYPVLLAAVNALAQAIGATLPRAESAEPREQEGTWRQADCQDAAEREYEAALQDALNKY